MKRTMYCGLRAFIGAFVLLAAPLFAVEGEFTGTLTVTGTSIDQLKFGLRTDSTDGNDLEGVQDPDQTIPPSPPSGENYLYFVAPPPVHTLSEDYKSAPATSKLWTLIVVKPDAAQDITISWAVTNFPAGGTLKLLDAQQTVLVEDLTTAGSRTLLGGTYYIQFGGAPPPQEGSIEVAVKKSIGGTVTDYEDEAWSITKRTMTNDKYDAALNSSDNDLSYNQDGTTFWRNGSTDTGRLLTGIQTGEYYIHFKQETAAWTTPERIDLTVTAGSSQTFEATYVQVPASVTVTPSGITTTEAGGSSEISVVLTAEPANDVTVTPSLAGANPAAAALAAGPAITFTAANWGTAQVITVTGVDDGTTYNGAGGGRAYTVALAVTSIDDRYEGFALTPVVGFTTDNDAPGLVVSQSTGLLTNEDAAAANHSAAFDVSLQSQPTQDVTVTLQSSDAGEGVAQPATVTFSADGHDETFAWNAPQTITVTGQDDADVDGDVPYEIVVAATSTDANYSNLVKTVLATNIDDDSDVPNVTFSPLSLAFGNVEVGNDKRLFVALTNTGAEITYDLATSDTQFVIGDASVVVPAAADGTDGAAAVAVTFQPSAAGAQSGTLTFSVGGTPKKVINLSGAGLVSPGTITATATGDDTTTDETGDTAEITIALSAAPASAVTVTIVSDDTSEGTVNPNTLVLDANNYNSAANTVTITGVNDDVLDGDVSYNVTCSITTSTAPRFPVGLSTAVTLVNQDEGDTPASDVSATPATLNFGEVVISGPRKALKVTISNTSGAAKTLTPAITGDANDAFDVDTAPVAVPDGVPTELTVYYNPAAVGSDTASLTLDDGQGVVATVELVGTGRLPYDGGTLAFDPSYFVVEQGGNGQITFDVTISATADLVQLVFVLEVPSVVTLGTITTDTANTSGTSFVVDSLSDTRKVLSYFSAGGSGISTTANSRILTVAATVTDVTTQAVYDLIITDAGAQDINGKIYELTPQTGAFAVSTVVALADLDVNDDGQVLTNDLILIFRKINLVDKYGLALLAEGMTLPDGVTEDQVKKNIEDLVKNGLDVNEDGLVLTNDLILVFRKINLVDKYGLALLAEGMTLPDGITEDAVKKNIEDIMP